MLMSRTKRLLFSRHLFSQYVTWTWREKASCETPDLESMALRSEATVTVDAEMRVPLAMTQLVRFHHTAPVDDILREEETYWLDLCLTPRPANARGCYVDRWGPHRFERI